VPGKWITELEEHLSSFNSFQADLKTADAFLMRRVSGISGADHIAIVAHHRVANEGRVRIPISLNLNSSEGLVPDSVCAGLYLGKKARATKSPRLD
jgi:hypothetical protein